MKRRTVLAAVAASTVGVSGCSALSSDSDRTGSPEDDNQTDPEAPVDESPGGDGQTDPGESADESPPVPEPSGECGPASQPLRDVLTDDVGPDCDVSDRTPEVRFENGRDAGLSAEASIDHDGDTVWEASIELDPGQDTDMDPDLPAERIDSVTITFSDGTEFADEWSGDSCRLHGVAIGDEDIEAGFVEPVDGSIDGSFACYSGRAREFKVSNSTEEELAVTVTVVDHCAETTSETSMELRRRAEDTVTESLLIGGRYTVVVDVDGGPDGTAEYGANCGVYRASIHEDEISFGSIIY